MDFHFSYRLFRQWFIPIYASLCLFKSQNKLLLFAANCDVVVENYLIMAICYSKFLKFNIKKIVCLQPKSHRLNEYKKKRRKDIKIKKLVHRIHLLCFQLSKDLFELWKVLNCLNVGEMSASVRGCNHADNILSWVINVSDGSKNLEQ